MTRLENIQQLCKWLRYFVIGITAALLALLLVGHFVLDLGVIEVTTKEGMLEQLKDAGADNMGLLIIVMPVVVLALWIVYWLQRLLGEYQMGQFFTESSMTCYLWLVWLKVASFAYGLFWPVLAMGLMSADSGYEMNFTLSLNELFTLFLLVVIVHLLKEAQAISNENKEFI